MRQAIKPDRYISFKGIDCAGNAKRLMAMLRHHLESPENDNRFWQMFMAKLQAAECGEPVNGIRIDALFLIHAYLNNLQEFFEQRGDRDALALLERIERECC